jgi:DNA polymerase III epsilon subunit-like protein
MTYFVFDTETSGLPKSYARVTPRNLTNYDECRILSVAIVQYDDNHQETGHYYKLLKHPEGHHMGGTEIHGIQQSQLDARGIPFQEVYDYMRSLGTAKIMGHNLDFDINVMRAECIRYQMDPTFLDEMDQVCTLKLARNIYMGTVSCKLGDLHQRLLGKPLEGAHDALEDCRGCARIFPLLLKDPRKYQPIPTKYVVVSASKVAAAVGKHPYQKRVEYMEELWNKYSPDTFTGKTKEQAELEAIGLSQVAEAVVAQVGWEKPETSEEVAFLCERAKESLEADRVLTRAQKSMVMNHVRHKVYTTRGTRKEDDTAQQDSATLYEDEKFYKETICEVAGTRYVVVGRIDRYEVLPDGSYRMVEIKNRTKCLFKSPPKYEVIQCQTYMHMLGIEETRLLQQFNDQQQSDFLKRDREMWKDIKTDLVEFVKTLHSTMAA